MYRIILSSTSEIKNNVRNIENSVSGVVQTRQIKLHENNIRCRPRGEND